MNDTSARQHFSLTSRTALILSGGFLRYILHVAVLLVSGAVHAQDTGVPMVGLEDTVLRREIVSLFGKMADTDSVFKRGYGYLIVDDRRFLRGDTLTRWLISPQIARFDGQSLFPDEYTLIAGRLVLLYHYPAATTPGQLGLTGKEKFIRLVEEFTDPRQKREEENIASDFERAVGRNSPPGRKDKGNRFGYFYYGLATEIFKLKDGNYRVTRNINP